MPKIMTGFRFLLSPKRLNSRNFLSIHTALLTFVWIITLAVIEGKGRGTYIWYSTSSWIITSEALRYDICSRGISQFYLHTHTFIGSQNEPYLPLPSQL